MLGGKDHPRSISVLSRIPIHRNMSDTDKINSFCYFLIFVQRAASLGLRCRNPGLDSPHARIPSGSNPSLNCLACPHLITIPSGTPRSWEPAPACLAFICYNYNYVYLLREFLHRHVGDPVARAGLGSPGGRCRAFAHPAALTQPGRSRKVYPRLIYYYPSSHVHPTRKQVSFRNPARDHMAVLTVTGRGS